MSTDDKAGEAPAAAGSTGPGQVKLEVRVDDAVAPGVYSNGLMVHVSETEMTLDFLHVEPARPLARVRSRVVVAPRQARRMLRLLQDNLRRYEQRFGPIPDAKAPGPGDPIIH